MSESPDQFSMNPEQIAMMQSQQNSNPLHKFMRQPSIYVKLPSNGNFYPRNTLEMPINGEVAILPMSTRDEIGVNTPDALLNGQAVVDMIHSCVPSIKNAWCVPAIDLDTLFIAIRIASYGEKMEYTSTCPECNNSDNYEIDLKQFLDMPVDISGFEAPFMYKNMQIFMKPADFETVNMQNQEQFEQQRLIVVINDSELDNEEKQRRFTQIFRKMTEYTVKNVSGSISHIITPEGETVTDPNFIAEFVSNSERALFDGVRKHLEKVVAGIPEKKVNTKCDSCSHEYTTPFTFDQSNFFAYAS